ALGNPQKHPRKSASFPDHRQIAQHGCRPIIMFMPTLAGMDSDEQASRLKNEFLARAKMLSNLQEVYRSSLVTQLLSDALAMGLPLEAEIFEAAYGDPAGR